ncbi:MAG: efflux RND transporter periplasmic adaptor subunit [Candidatus Sumerlaeota bacterium]|nr:efflux RND transporter periplasmic adaptor subunit [Candidatus Sumerlaeota bacterium]
MRIRHRSGLIFTAGTFAAGLMLLAGCDRPAAGPGGPMPGGTPEVLVMTVQPERVTITAELPGRTSACIVAEVRPQVNGIIQKRLFSEGSDVKAGEVLYEIDPAPYRAAYDNTTAALARAEANLPPIQSKAERNKKLIASGAIGQQEYDDIAGTLKQTKAEIEQLKAAAALARINLGYTRVNAPITGRIGKSNVTEGALATAHQGPPLATIQQTDPIYVDAPQSSANLLRLKRKIAAGRIVMDSPSQAAVKLLLEDGTSYSLEGTLKFSDVTVDPSTGSFIFRMSFPNPDRILLPGMYVRAVLAEGVIEQAILVPQLGIAHDPKGNAIALVVDSADKVEQRVVKVERSVGDKWLVSEGLKPGDRVILEGLQKIRPGVSVKVASSGANTDTTAPANADAPAEIKK